MWEYRTDRNKSLIIIVGVKRKYCLHLQGLARPLAESSACAYTSLALFIHGFVFSPLLLCILFERLKAKNPVLEAAKPVIRFKDSGLEGSLST